MSTDQAVGAGVGDALLASPARRAIVEALQRYPRAEDEADPGGMTAAQLAELLGLHLTTVRFHADRLEAAGLVCSHFTTAFGVGRPRKVYAVTARAEATDQVGYLLRLLELMIESFSSGASPDQAGEQWAAHHLPFSPAEPAKSPGAWLSKVGPVVDVLQDWGYAPELTTADGGRTCRISLTRCPYLELARANPDVVCGIHRGVLVGALRQLGEVDVGVSIKPFVGPSLCHAQITTHQQFDHHLEESLDESRQSDATGPDLGPPVLHQGEGERRPSKPPQGGRPRR